MMINRYAAGAIATGLSALLGAAGYQGHLNESLVTGLWSSLQSPSHVLTMLGVGMWGAQFRQFVRWLIPLLFAGMMAVGMIAASLGFFIPYNNMLVAVSLLILALLLFGVIELKTVVGITLAALLASFQGFDHGRDLQAGSDATAYGVGFTVASFLLQSTGILSTRELSKRFGIRPLKLFALLCGGTGLYELIR